MTESNLIWQYHRAVPQLPSPLIYKQVLYMLNDGGMMTSFKPESGEVIAKGRVKGSGAHFYASPVAADNKIFIISQRGKVSVLKSDGSLELMAQRMLDKGTKPELEIFDVGMIGNCLTLMERDLLQTPLHFQFVLGAPGGSPGTVKTLVHMLDMVPADSTWSVAGIGRAQLPLAVIGMAMGGHVRVGLEDNIYFSRGVLARSNAELVDRVVRIAREYGREPATPDETRELLGLNRTAR